MQNSGLAVALSIKYFSTLSALPGAIFSIWYNIARSIIASIWAKQEKYYLTQSMIVSHNE
ncbi:hypothetical protein [Arcobacter sp. F2176]|uniref:hypothetical protein n=1 Tax=unclassified Arcobacter TaxID=2593671 RepID=UPI002159ECB0|nr:hypothetical protein [Arcobacter sp. F2176]